MSKQRIPTNRAPLHQTPQAGKVENDSNQVGDSRPTQKNEGRRTPQSRNDRESQVGSHNQSQSRRGGGSGGGAGGAR